MSKEFKNLKNKIDIASQMLCDIHKLVSMANKYCKAQKENDSFYEISYVINVIEEKINKLGYYIYCILNEKENPDSFEKIMEKIKTAIENNEIELVDN